MGVWLEWAEHGLFPFDHLTAKLTYSFDTPATVGNLYLASM